MADYDVEKYFAANALSYPSHQMGATAWSRHCTSPVFSCGGNRLLRPSRGAEQGVLVLLFSQPKETRREEVNFGLLNSQHEFRRRI